AGDLGPGLDDVPGPAVEFDRAELLGREGVAPLHEGPLGELHDVALVDERDALAPAFDRVADRGADEALGPLLAYGFDADAGRAGEADLAVELGEGLLEEVLELLRVLAAVLELDAGVDVLGVLAEDDHVGQLRLLDGAGNALEVADGAEADVEVED